MGERTRRDVLTYVHDPVRGAADLMILSAQEFTGEPPARVHLPRRGAPGFHGSWVPTVWVRKMFALPRLLPGY
ncbi:carotenoid oxygenase family protein [Actinomadura violacea]|uniref:Dioxygenase n=1 Tax=Actinomadura violacea TaxID=2819934 RepID=A0ABS3RWB8_9ACTN|nr:carotenoid oxygenase family protein [Actinomadura violacea]MBO2461052.1 carotenoid oxygenase family protein [Actinomadura violacea]